MSLAGLKEPDTGANNYDSESSGLHHIPGSVAGFARDWKLEVAEAHAKPANRFSIMRCIGIDDVGEGKSLVL